MAEAIIIKASTADPIVIDVGNQKIQGRVVSKTIQFGLFTMNANAVWGAKNQLRKESYPFATVNLKVNRFAFKYEVGDCFRFSYPKYGLSDIVLRVLRRIETELESEEINVIAMEDLFAITNTISEYSAATSYTQPRVDYTVDPIVNQRIIESLYAWTGGNLAISALAARPDQIDLAFQSYLSLDYGVSYLANPIGLPTNFRAYGTLAADYPGPGGWPNPHGTYEIDETVGLIVDFINADVNFIESQEWATILSGTNNLAVIGAEEEEEVISFKTITPIAGTQYKLEGIIRGRYGTLKREHYTGDAFYFLGQDVPVAENENIQAGADLYFKLVGYNAVQFGNISEATALNLFILGVAKTPYLPINFRANGKARNSRYTTDIVLTWSARHRSKGAGIGIPGIVLSDTEFEGFFKVMVYNDAYELVRTTIAINATTWTYTEAMNRADNGGDLIINPLFFLSNYRVEDGVTYGTDPDDNGNCFVTCRLSSLLAS